MTGWTLDYIMYETTPTQLMLLASAEEKEKPEKLTKAEDVKAFFGSLKY